MKRIVKKSLRGLFKKIPHKKRHAFIRSRLELEYDLPEELTFKIAKTEEELEGSFQLLHDAYVEMGYMKPNKSKMRVTFYHMLPSTTNLVALYKGEVVATVSIIRDNSQGLPLESDFDLSEKRNEKATIAEISSLVVRKDFRKKGGLVLFPLLRFLWLYCRFYFAIDYIVMATNPRLADLFDAIILFKPLEDKVVKNYGFANGAPAVARILDLRLAPTMYATKYGDKVLKKNLFFFMVTPEMGGTEFPCIQLPKRQDFRISDPVMTPKLFRSLFVEKANALKELTTNQKVKLLSLYSDHEYQQVREISELTDWAHRSETRIGEKRHEVRCEALLNPAFNSADDIPLQVVDVSSNGLGCKTDKLVNKDSVYKIKVGIAPLNVVELSVKVMWSNEKGSVGLKVLKPTEQWQQYIESFQPTNQGQAA